MAERWDAMVTVGRIVRPHGRQGAVVVAPETDFAAERFKPGSVLQWRASGAIAPVRVAGSREFRGRWIVTFDGIGTMNEAEALRDLELKVEATDVAALGPGAHYVHDLEGCVVTTVGGVVVGRVERVDRGVGAPILVVKDDRGGEVLVPFAEAICRQVVPSEKRIVIDPPDGLVDLNRTGRS